MSFQGYLDTIKTNTGKTPEEFVSLAERNGPARTGRQAGHRAIQTFRGRTAEFRARCRRHGCASL